MSCTLLHISDARDALKLCDWRCCEEPHTHTTYTHTHTHTHTTYTHSRRECVRYDDGVCVCVCVCVYATQRKSWGEEAIFALEAKISTGACVHTNTDNTRGRTRARAPTPTHPHTLPRGRAGEWKAGEWKQRYQRTRSTGVLISSCLNVRRQSVYPPPLRLRSRRCASSSRRRWDLRAPRRLPRLSTPP